MATTQLDLSIQSLDQSLTNAKIRDGEITGAKLSASAAVPYSKLSLTDSLQNSDISPSAAISYSKLNLATSITNSDIAALAAIAYSKLNLSSSIVNADIGAAAGIAYSKLNLSASIANSDVSPSAAIAYSKLSLASSIVNADISSSAAIAYAKLALSASITDSDIAAAAGIAYSKLSLTSSIVNADISASAAIAYSKLSLAGSVTNADLAGSIADSKLATLYTKADGTRAFTGEQSMGGFKLTNLASPTAAGDAARKDYVDNLTSGLAWVPPAEVRNLVGNATVATLNGLGAAAGNAYVVTDAGSLTRGTLSVAAGDLVEDDGTVWVMIQVNSGGFVPAGVRAILAKSPALLSPYTEGVDDNKIAQFDGLSNTASSLTTPVSGNSILIHDTNDPSVGYYDNNAFVFEGTGATGSWIQWTGAAGVNAGAGMTKDGNTLNVGAGDGIQSDVDSVTVKIDGSTLSKSASGLKVAALGITNAEVSASAAIAGTKISPDFGSQNILTTGNFGKNIASPVFSVDIVDDGNTNRGFHNTSYGSAGTIDPTFRGRRARGSLASPAAVQSGDSLVQFSGTGWVGGTTNAFRSSPAGSMAVLASETWGDTNQGTNLVLRTVSTGATTLSERVRIDGSGNVGVGTASPGYKMDVAGDVNTSGLYRVSGSQIASVNLSDNSNLLHITTYYTAKGDLAAGTGAGTAGTLTVGTNGYALVADSSQTTGLRWASVATGSVSTRETPSGLVNGSNTVFTLANTPIAGSEEVYLNGLLQDVGAGNDYTISSGTITFASAPLTGSKIRVSYRY